MNFKRLKRFKSFFLVALFLLSFMFSDYLIKTVDARFASCNVSADNFITCRNVGQPVIQDSRAYMDQTMNVRAGASSDGAYLTASYVDLHPNVTRGQVRYRYFYINDNIGTNNKYFYDLNFHFANDFPSGVRINLNNHVTRSSPTNQTQFSMFQQSFNSILNSGPLVEQITGIGSFR